MPRRKKYREGKASTVSHAGHVYSVDKLLATSERKRRQQFRVKGLDWIFRFAKPEPARVKAADLDVPILVTRSAGRSVVLDGLHRLARARAEGRPTIPGRYVTAAELDKAKIK